MSLGESLWYEMAECILLIILRASGKWNFITILASSSFQISFELLDRDSIKFSALSRPTLWHNRKNARRDASKLHQHHPTNRITTTSQWNFNSMWERTTIIPNQISARFLCFIATLFKVKQFFFDFTKNEKQQKSQEEDLRAEIVCMKFFFYFEGLLNQTQSKREKRRRSKPAKENSQIHHDSMGSKSR